MKNKTEYLLEQIILDNLLEKIKKSNDKKLYKQLKKFINKTDLKTEIKETNTDYIYPKCKIVENFEKIIDRIANAFYTLGFNNPYLSLPKALNKRIIIDCINKIVVYYGNTKTIKIFYNDDNYEIETYEIDEFTYEYKEFVSKFEEGKKNKLAKIFNKGLQKTIQYYYKDINNAIIVKDNQKEYEYKKGILYYLDEKNNIKYEVYNNSASLEIHNRVISKIIFKRLRKFIKNISNVYDNKLNAKIVLE